MVDTHRLWSRRGIARAMGGFCLVIWPRGGIPYYTVPPPFFMEQSPFSPLHWTLGVLHNVECTELNVQKRHRVC